MRSFVVAAALSLCATLVKAQNYVATADAYFTKEVPIAKYGLHANIGPSGARVAGAGSGLVIASPSKSNPDYFYTWTRDASLVYKYIVEEFLRTEDPFLRGQIDLFVNSQEQLQGVSNPSGGPTTGGLGEPKFMADGTAFTGGWGRPQRDGPPLRATSLIPYANYLLDNGNTTWVSSKLWPIIKKDLDYSAQYWNQTGFDLWEEVSSSSFFTTATQARALREGATLATRLGQTAAAGTYNTQASNTLCFLQSYWNPSGGYITSNTGGGRSGKDANSALASVHLFEPSAGCDATTFQPCSDKALSSLKEYIDSFRQIYPINHGRPANGPVATGRYQEDVYYGGQPWYLTTAIVSEQLYNAIIVWTAEEEITITPISLAFFRQFIPNVNAGTYPSTSATYTTLLSAVKNFADGFIAVISEYTPADGALSEQYRRDTGAQTSATHLTWSYASILTAHSARLGHVQPAWGATGFTAPSTCSTGGGGGPGVQVTFNVNAQTVWGENIFLVGSINELKNWNPSDAIALNADNYPTWRVTVSIPAGTSFEYKFIRKNGGSVQWESDPNRSYQSPESGSATLNLTWK